MATVAKTDTDLLHREAIAFYKTIQDYERHFNQMEFEVRKLASAWLLVGFGAIAFLIRGGLDSSHSMGTSLQLLVAVCALTQIGLFLLWILDQVVYHGLLDAAFSVALHIERRYSELPPLRSMMMRISAGDALGKGGTGMARYMKLFYVLPMFAFAVLSWAATALDASGSQPASPILIVTSIAIATVPFWVLLKSHDMELGKKQNRPSGEGEYKKRPYDLAVDRWLRQMSR